VSSSGSKRVTGIAVGVLAGAFFVSAAASAGATVFVSSRSADVAAEGFSTQESSPNPGPTLRSTPRASASPSPSSSPTRNAEPPTRRDLVRATARLCDASLTDLPRMTLIDAPGNWTLTFERFMWDLELDPGEVDTQFTIETRRALREYQSDAGINVTGIVDRQTWAALQEARCEIEEPDPAPAPPPAPAPAPAPQPPSGGSGGSSGGSDTLIRVE